MAVKNSLQKTGNNAPSQKLTISGYLGQEKIKTWINGMIGSEKEAQKFISSIISATSTTPALQACEPTTIVSSALLANALDLSLSPQLGLAYMVPFEDNKNGRTVATFILGYKGYIQLAIRSGKYRKINVVAVKEGEFVSYNSLTEDLQVNLIADDEERERAATVGYYAYFELVNGFQKSLYWSKKSRLSQLRFFLRQEQHGLCRPVVFRDSELCTGRRGYVAHHGYNVRLRYAYGTQKRHPAGQRDLLSYGDGQQFTPYAAYLPVRARLVWAWLYGCVLQFP